MQHTSRLMKRALTQYRPCTSAALRATQPLRNTLPRFPSASQPRFQPLTIRGIRHQSSLIVPEAEARAETPRPPTPSYQLTFTCKPCDHRSSHNVTKQGYHHGTVLITCPKCRSRHVISDHLKIFMDEASTLEDILKRSAGTDQDLSKLLKKGRLGQREGQLVGNEGEEEIEFWEDGSETKHSPTST